MFHRKQRKQQIKLKHQNHESPATLLFEMDGIVLDSIPTLFQIYLQLLAKRSIKGTKKEFNQLQGLPLKEYVEQIISIYGFHISTKKLQEEYSKLLSEANLSMDSAVKTISDLIVAASQQGFTIGIVSLQSKTHTKKCLQNIAPFVDAIFTSDIISDEPSFSPNLFQHALSVFGCDAEDCVAIVHSSQAFTNAQEAGMYVFSAKDKVGTLSDKKCQRLKDSQIFDSILNALHLR